MRLLSIGLLVLVLLTQYTLWWGKGGWFRLRELQQQVDTLTEANQVLTVRNNALQAEVAGLLDGTAAVEERARSELNMIRKGEHFVQILP